MSRGKQPWSNYVVLMHISWDALSFYLEKTSVAAFTFPAIDKAGHSIKCITPLHVDCTACGFFKLCCQLSLPDLCQQTQDERWSPCKQQVDIQIVSSALAGLIKVEFE